MKLSSSLELKAILKGFMVYLMDELVFRIWAVQLCWINIILVIVNDNHGRFAKTHYGRKHKESKALKTQTDQNTIPCGHWLFCEDTYNKFTLVTWFKCGWNNQVRARVQQITASHLTTVDEDWRASSGSMISKVVSLSPSTFQILISDLVMKTNTTLQMMPMVNYKRGSMKLIERSWLYWCQNYFTYLYSILFHLLQLRETK